MLDWTSLKRQRRAIAARWIESRAIAAVPVKSS
jgi:hypothetical protein